MPNRASGTGIGLSVAKRAAQIHGGYVWVTSDEARRHYILCSHSG